MNPDELNARLSGLSTAWTDLHDAHAVSDQFQHEAQKAVLERYQ